MSKDEFNVPIEFTKRLNDILVPFEVDDDWSKNDEVTIIYGLTNCCFVSRMQVIIETYQ